MGHYYGKGKSTLDGANIVYTMMISGGGAGLIRSGILFLDATYATCSVGLRATL